MANLQGYTTGAVGNMLNHYTRHDGDPEQSKYRYQNQKIDVTRTHLNYALSERPEPKAFIRRRVAEADTKPTKKTNVISDWIVTLPKNDALAGREREFFVQSYDFLAEKVGRDNIVGAWVHNDETSPHMHFCFVPLCGQTVMTNDKTQPLRWTKRDEAKNPAHKAGEVKRDAKGTVRYRRVQATDESGNPIVKRTVSLSKVFDRKAMRGFHPALEQHLERHFGFKVGIQLEDEGDKLLSQLGHSEYVAAKTKLVETRAEVDRLEDQREEIRQKASAEAERLEDLQRARGAAEERVEVLEAVAAECRAADDAPVSRRSGILNRIDALCNGFVEKLGMVIRRAGERTPLALTIRHGAAAGTSPRSWRRTLQGAQTGMTAPPAPQMEYAL